jgi:hypothetical protein
MHSSISAEISYLLLMPLQASRPTGVPEPATVKKDVPYFFDLNIEFLSAGERRLEIEGVGVRSRFQILDGQVWLAECRFRLPDILTEAVVVHKQAIQAELRRRLQQELGYSGSFSEEYTIVLLQDVALKPDGFVAEQAPTLARLLRSTDKPLTEAETAGILEARARYAEDDLTIVDWEGAIVIARDGDFQSDIELMKIGNYQLLRYRLVDREIERHLEDLRGRVTGNRRYGRSSKRKMLQQIIEQRLTILLDFEKIDQSLLLIGDWYSAEVYRLIVDQFYLDEWKTLVSAKLDQLAAIDEVVRQNLTFSWDRLLALIEIAGWLLLLIGYFLLFFVDLGWFS